jgi:hypothetical protein
MKAAPPGGAALLSVPVSEHRAFFGNAVDVRRTVAHRAVIVGADVPPAYVVAPYDKNVGLVGLWHIRFPFSGSLVSKPSASHHHGIHSPGFGENKAGSTTGRMMGLLFPY